MKAPKARFQTLLFEAAPAVRCVTRVTHSPIVACRLSRAARLGGTEAPRSGAGPFSRKLQGATAQARAVCRVRAPCHDGGPRLR